MCRTVSASCSKIPGYIISACKPSGPTQDSNPIGTRISVVICGVFAVLSIVFLAFALNPKRNLKLFLGLSAASSCLSMFSICVRCCVSDVPPRLHPPKGKKHSSASPVPSGSPSQHPSRSGSEHKSGSPSTKSASVSPLGDHS